MKRRELLKGLAAVPLFGSVVFGAGRRAVRSERMIKPKRLAKGDTVALIAPASSIEAKGFDAAVQNLESFGLKVKLGKYVRSRNGFLAGTDKQRLEDLHGAFADKDVDAIWCIRGGYGITRYLPDLDLKLIKANPKILIGYSDVTALLTAITQNTGLVTFHGPTAGGTFSEYSRMHALNVLMNPAANYKIAVSPENAANTSNLFQTETITKGKCRGELIGGNLSLLSALAGTRSALRNLKGKILFLEDVREQPYRIDRMLTQLKQSVDLRECAGIALGIFVGCNPTDPQSQTLIEVLKDRLGDLGIPVIYGLSFGHIRDQFTLPVGVKAELDTETAVMTLVETAVS
ncbi:MAG: LD-carboxypeptidase [Pyrinomonadaceae bacterium]